MPEPGFISYNARKVDDPLSTLNNWYQDMDQRRSVRDFSDKAVPREEVEQLIRIASTAPSGAHKQPWTFVAVSNPILKKKIREAAEKEEYEFYHGRATQEWLDDLAPIGTDWHKPFLEIAPWLIVVFKKSYNNEGEGKSKNYYVQESVGIACGFLIAAIHQAGLVTLTHTPSPMNFLADILERPANEKPFLLLPVGYPASDACVPDLKRKALAEVSEFYQ
ncbi:MAG TPA: nitroreductase family protein [Cryomorphaceae bacterium]|nr:nitroreductase family protein [Owenweeksia sp.]MBF99176.1 nitroreductase family protein [Owenweeksia sp.]HAD98821.1 nitroreductase family protein [Cryomorphaceae bacterium]HBF19305.1 nitroreductase family protein [Cryomorphaceae bacterium]|tara:strand:+ start:464 stop:1123 length:660 start_codon:yes stop_codon:yes gene_type:complete